MSGIRGSSVFEDQNAPLFAINFEEELGENSQQVGKKKNQDYNDFDWAEAFDRLFVEPESDEPKAFKLREPKQPYYQLDLEAVLAGPSLFPNAGYCDAYYSDDFGLDDDDYAISCSKVCATKAGKKKSRGETRRDFRSAMSYSRRTKRALSPIRARMLQKEALRAGWYESRPISHGSFGPFGFEEE